jgi:dTDP-L-rhamnose 4-epimerase
VAIGASKGLVLVTGGAGFIGSHLVDRLVNDGYRVRILDALLPQVHPSGPPTYLNPAAELRVGDVRDKAAVRSALEGADIVVHFAAAEGVGQSMYEPVHFCSVNVQGTAVLLETMMKEKIRPRRMLVASSMSIYGEGLFVCYECGPRSPGPRLAAQLARSDWNVRCPLCNQAMESRPTPETKPIMPTSIYAVNKRDQEEMTLVAGRTIGVPTVALRFFNVYGDRQSLSNPYTGVAAIFSSALLNRRPPILFEDGKQSRDFIHVSDLVDGCVKAIEAEGVADEVFNIGTGASTDLLSLLELLKREIPGAADVQPEILGRFREGDIRSCIADITKARERLRFSPKVPIEEGVKGLAAWVRSQTSVDRSAHALEELKAHNLVR